MCWLLLSVKNLLHISLHELPPLHRLGVSVLAAVGRGGGRPSEIPLLRGRVHVVLAVRRLCGVAVVFLCWGVGGSGLGWGHGFRQQRLLMDSNGRGFRGEDVRVALVLACFHAQRHVL